MIFYFSGCGNSRWVAEELSKALNEELRFIPELHRQGMDRYVISEDEVIGFVFPIYSWAAPKLVEDFVRQIRWEGKAVYTWYACTCGDESGMTHKTFRKVMAGAGLELGGAFTIQMPETYLDMPGFHLDSPEGAMRKIEAARGKLPWVAEKIRGHESVEDIIMGSFSRLKSYVIRPGFVKNASDRKYHVTDACTGCGICVKSCPLENIRLTEGRPKWLGGCTQCMACYHHCPQNAIHFGNCTVGKGQYYFGKKL